MSRQRVIVVGLGAVGSAAALHLARAGVSVVGIDRWRPPHRWGSTHGESRITRATAWEGTQYVPLVARAQALWREFSARTGTSYFDACGGLFVGHADEYHVAGSRASAEACGLPFELLDRAAMAQRWPWLAVPEGMLGFLDPGAGVLAPERIVADQLAAAADAGADLRYDTEVLRFSETRDAVVVETSRGTLQADHLLLCAGGWMPELLADLGVATQVERVTQHWFAEPQGVALRDATVAPVLLLSDGEGHATAAFPTRDGHVKAAGHGSGTLSGIAELDRRVHPDDIAAAEGILRRYLPRHVGAHRDSVVCHYTRTASGHFVIDRHPQLRRCHVASACNGFGFKFSVAVGEMLAKLALDEPPPVNPAPWRLA